MSPASHSPKPPQTPARTASRLLACVLMLCAAATQVRASSTVTIFSNNYGTNPCTIAAPCWQAGMFGMLIGLGSAVGNPGTLRTTSSGDIITGTGTGGDIGIGSGSFVNNGTNTENWTGPIDFADAAATTSHGYSVPSSSDVLTNTTLVGGTQTSFSAVTTALNQVLSLSTYYAGQTGTNLGVLTGGTTLGSITNGVKVYNVSSINLTSVLTIRGGANDIIVINDPSSAFFTKNVVLTGGITSDNVLFNITGTGNNILSIKGGTGAGKITITADMIVRGSYSGTNATVDGRILGGWNTMSLGTAFALVAPNDIPGPVPEPGEWALMAGGLAALFYLGRKARHAHHRRTGVLDSGIPPTSES